MAPFRADCAPGRRKPSSARTQGVFVAGSYGRDRGRGNATVCSRLRRARCVDGGHHLAFSTISARRQRLVFDSGRVSTMRTVSPTPAVLASSCAWNLTVERTTFLYLGWLLITSTLTTIVFSPLSEMTTPRRSWRRPRSLPASRCGGSAWGGGGSSAPVFFPP